MTERSPVPEPAALVGSPAPAPRSEDLPPDVLVLDGPEAVRGLGGAAGLQERLGRVLSRPGPAVVVSTSGSTGRPKRTVLTAQSLRASGQATAERTGGHGQWLLCLPAHYVAGVQVLARSALAGTRPVELPAGPFDAHGFARAAARMTGRTRHVSLVPTQLARLVEAAEDPQDGTAVRRALTRFDSVLLGGSAASPRLLERAAALGARVVTTYGMSETCGGCVYDGSPLAGVRIRIEDAEAGSPAGSRDPQGTGRIWLGGEVVTPGYLDDDPQTARHVRLIDGQRWYRTDDLGRWDGRRLSVSGRADDVIVTGGLKVSAGVVAQQLMRDPGVAQALVLGLPDPQWGQAVAALVVPEDAPAPGGSAGSGLGGSAADGPGGIGPALRERLSADVRQALGAAAVPKRWALAPQMPMLGTGKPDRAAARRLLERASS